MRVLVTGASGFVGNHVVEALLAEGHEVVGLSRTAPKGDRNKPGAVYFHGVDVADAKTIKDQYFSCVDVVVHLVGIIMERKANGQTFQRIHVEGTQNIVAAAKKAEVSRIVYLSAIGSSPNAAAEYSRTKFAAEEIVRGSGIPFVILRPSIILGKDGEFVAQMKDLILHGGLPVALPFPVVPVPGPGTNKFQPIFVDDLMKCIVGSVDDTALANQIVELGGAVQVSFNSLLKSFESHLGVNKPLVHAPINLLALIAPLVEMLPNPPFSADQLKNLKSNNIADIDPMKKAFQFMPIGFEEQLDRIYAK